MKPVVLRPGATHPIDIAAAAQNIAAVQLGDGAIPWFPGHKIDPWDHVEAAMGLAIGGHLDRARAAFDWLARLQLEDGSWYTAYRNGAVEDRTRDANLCAYVAVGVYHYYLITGNLDFVRGIWPTVAAAINFALRLQRPEGEIHWAISPEGQVDPMALLTGSSSIYMSLKCAVALAEKLRHDTRRWRAAMARLGQAICFKPHVFNVTKARFSMDWFYPILCGAVSGTRARQRVQRHWEKFVVEGQGVKCVADQPWVTLAETAELILALEAMGRRDLAETVFAWMGEKRFEDRTYWCGFTYPEKVVWPEEKHAWTNAAVMLAADALYQLTPAGRIFSHRFWAEKGIP
jgi:hypothetical protein